MSIPSFFVDAPTDVRTLLEGKLGKLPLLMCEDNEIFTDIKLEEALLGKVAGLYGYDDVEVFRFGFSTTINTESIAKGKLNSSEKFTIDVFFPENYDPYSDEFMVDSAVSKAIYDYKLGFIASATREEKFCVEDLKYVLMELDFTKELKNPSVFSAWRKNYVSKVESKWNEDFPKYITDLKQCKYVNENNVELIMNNDFCIYSNPSSIYHEIARTKNKHEK